MLCYIECTQENDMIVSGNSTMSLHKNTLHVPHIYSNVTLRLIYLSDLKFYNVLEGVVCVIYTTSPPYRQSINPKKTTNRVISFAPINYKQSCVVYGV